LTPTLEINIRNYWYPDDIFLWLISTEVKLIENNIYGKFVNIKAVNRSCLSKNKW